MNDGPTTRLDSFETALLAELVSRIESGDSACLDTTPRTTGRRGYRRWLVPVTAVAAATTALSLLAYVLWPTPAYAVTGRNSGEVVVEVMRLEGADGLERALAKRGIPADITYLPYGQECAAGRYRERDTPGLTLSVASDSFQIEIPAGSVGRGDTFVLSASVMALAEETRSRVDFAVASGSVAPCRVVDSP